MKCPIGRIQSYDYDRALDAYFGMVKCGSEIYEVDSFTQADPYYSNGRIYFKPSHCAVRKGQRVRVEFRKGKIYRWVVLQDFDRALKKKHNAKNRKIRHRRPYSRAA